MSAPRTFRQHRFTPPPGATELILVRHGESAPAVAGESFDLVDGHGDPELSPEGREQAIKVCARLAGEGVDAIYVSKLRRTSETAQALSDALGLSMVVDPDLHEVFLGDWEGGLFRQKVAEADPIAMPQRPLGHLLVVHERPESRAAILQQEPAVFRAYDLRVFTRHVGAHGAEVAFTPPPNSENGLVDRDDPAPQRIVDLQAGVELCHRLVGYLGL